MGIAAPSRGEAERRAAEAASLRATQWLEGNLYHLEPPGGIGEFECRRLKVLCELGFLTNLGCGETRSLDLTKRVLDLIASAASGGRFLSALWHQPEQVNRHLPMLYCLARDARLRPCALADLRRLAERAGRYGSETIPFRILDTLFSEELIAGTGNFDKMAMLSHFGSTNPQTDLANLSRHDGYGITHTIFYLTAFGSRQWPREGSQRSRLLRILRAMRLKAEADVNWDLYAEFLACEAMLGGAAIDAAMRLVAAQQDDGSWRGPVSLDEELEGEGITEPSQVAFYTNYHTTLVAWMALQAVARTNAFEPAAIPGTTKDVRSYPYAGLNEAWRRLPGDFASLRLSSRPREPSRELETDPQGVLPYLEWNYWHTRLFRGVPPLAAPNDVGPQLRSCLEGSWRKLRCLLLMSDPALANPRLVLKLRDRALLDLRTVTMKESGRPSLIDRLVCLGLLASTVDCDPALPECANTHVMLGLLRKDPFAIAPAVAFLRQWLERDTLMAAEEFLEEARSYSLPYNYVFAADEQELRRSLSCETYLEQIRLAALSEAKDGGYPKLASRS